MTRRVLTCFFLALAILLVSANDGKCRTHRRFGCVEDVNGPGCGPNAQCVDIGNSKGEYECICREDVPDGNSGALHIIPDEFDFVKPT